MITKPMGTFVSYVMYVNVVIYQYVERNVFSNIKLNKISTMFESYNILCDCMISILNSKNKVDRKIL